MQSETIYFYSTNPQHHGTIANATIIYTESNRICGDVITVYIRISDDIIQEWSFGGEVSMITLACSGLF
jgi:nitrogen fixation NifU-like protein